jgi:mono/diheme cytochrome c family protein
MPFQAVATIRCIAMKTSAFVLAGMFVAAASPLALAQDPGNAERGLAIAREQCAACHTVENNDGASPNAAAPPFRAIARTPGMTEIALFAALRTPHTGGQMPLVLPRESDVHDVIRYIRSLRQEPQ